MACCFLLVRCLNILCNQIWNVKIFICHNIEREKVLAFGQPYQFLAVSGKTQAHSGLSRKTYEAIIK